MAVIVRGAANTSISIELLHPKLSLKARLVELPTWIAFIFIEFVLELPFIFKIFEKVQVLLKLGLEADDEIVAVFPYVIS